MKTWRSGDLMSIASGVVLLVGAASPWVIDVGGRAAAAASSRGAASIALLAVAAAALMIAGSLRSSWTALVGLLDALLVAFVVFTVAIPAHAPGSAPGFGLYALASGGVFALSASVLNAIEREGDAL